MGNWRWKNGINRYDFTQFSEGYDDGYGLIFQMDTEKGFRVLLYTDYTGRELMAGEVPIREGGIPSQAWKDNTQWEPLSGVVSLSEFHTQCGGMVPAQSILSSLIPAKLVYVLALIGMVSLIYFACIQNKGNDFTLLTEQEET